MCMQFDVVILTTLFIVLFSLYCYNAVIICYHVLDNLIAGKYCVYLI